jgi:hypothetical protein
MTTEVVGPTLTGAREQARRHGLWLVAGNFLERIRVPGAERSFNTACLPSPQGQVCAAWVVLANRLRKRPGRCVGAAAGTMGRTALPCRKARHTGPL